MKNLLPIEKAYGQTIGPRPPETITPGSQTVQPSETTTEVRYEDDAFAALNRLKYIRIPWVSILIGIAALFTLGFLIYLYAKSLKKKDQDDKSKDGVLFEVRVPRGNELEIGVAEKMFANLYGIGGSGDGIKKWVTVKNCISFEIVGLPGEIRFYVYCPKKLADLVEKQILGSYQDAEVTVAKEFNIFHPDSKVAYASLVTTDESYYPIKVAEDFTGDPMANVLSSLSKLKEGEGVMIQLVISPADNSWQKNGRKFVEKVEKNNADPEKDRIHVSQEQMEGISRKTSKLGFNSVIRIVASASSEELANMHVNNILGAFEQYSNPGINEVKKEKFNRLNERVFMHNVIHRQMPLEPIVSFVKPKNGTSSILNVEELAGIYHYPNKDVETPNINWLLARELPAANWISSDIDSKDTIWLGNNIYRAQVKPICFKRDDRRRHAYIVGQTGSGKSWLLVRMLVQDIYNGDGVCFVDPHGSTAEMLLRRIPHERAEDVIYFNAADFDRPMGFNIMDFRNEHEKHMIINGFLDLLKKMFDPNNQGIVGPILERSMRNAMLTAMSKPGSSLLEVLRILMDPDWVKKEWLPHVKDDLVKRFWTDEVDKTTDFHKSEKLGYITSKLDRFVTNLAIRNIIAQSESSFDFREAMDSGKIVIVNLAKGLIGDFNAQFLGLLLIPKIVSAALSREDIPDEDLRKDFFFYVDEFQNFATDEFASILSEARKYRLNLTVANQYISQLSEDIKGAVFGNVGTLMIGRVGPEDADFLESQFQPHLGKNDLLNQPNIHYYVKLIADGKYPGPFSMDPAWGKRYPQSGFDVPENEEIADLIKQLSRLRYGRDVNVVQEEINKRAQLSVDTSKSDKKMGGLPPLGLK
ncbi:DUF87 domain-containing protein [Candidatus Dojkabacteria bacterium]|nr:DUF87 domain-containing protein [Candidatus Dojkabacteria bacterium]